MTPAAKHCRVLLILFLVTAAISETAPSQVPIPTITSFSHPGSNRAGDTSGAVPGSVVIVNGADFAMRDRSFQNTAHPHEAQAGIEFQSIKILFDTYVASESQLFFTVPLGIPCGTYRLFAINANVVLMGSGTLPSNMLTFRIACGPGGGAAEPLEPEITRIAPDEARAGDEVSVIGRNFVFPTQSSSDSYPFITISGVDVAAEWISITQVRFVIPASIPCGDLQPVQITNLATTFAQGVLTPGGGIDIPETIEITSTQVPLLIRCTGAQPPATPPTMAGSLSDLDADEDCHLSDGEFFSAIDLWISESIENHLFFAAVDGWIGQANICSAAAPLIKAPLRLAYRPSSALLEVTSASSAVKSLAVEVFDMRGTLLLSAESPSRSLKITLGIAGRDTLPNGVYWVRISARSAGGLLLHRDLQKILVLR